MVVKLVEGSLEYKIQHTFYMQLIGLNLAAKLIFLLLCFGLNHEPNPSILKYLNISLLFFLFFFYPSIDIFHCLHCRMKIWIYPLLRLMRHW